MKFLACILAALFPLVAIADSVDDVGLNDTQENVATAAVAGVAFCYDPPDNLVCISASAGDMVFLAGGETMTYDGTTLLLPDDGLTTTPQISFRSSGIGWSSDGTGSNLYFIQNNQGRAILSGAGIYGSAAGSAFTSFASGGITSITYAPNRTDIGVGFSGDGTNVRINGGWVLDADATQTLVHTTGQIDPNNARVKIVGSGTNPATLANPQITAGIDGQKLLIVGTDDSQCVQLTDGTGIQLGGAVAVTLCEADNITMCYDSAFSDSWYECGERVDN